MLKGYKTVIVNVASAVVGVLMVTDWVNLGLSDQTAGLVIGLLGAVNVGLRFLTTGPVPVVAKKT